MNCSKCGWSNKDADEDNRATCNSCGYINKDTREQEVYDCNRKVYRTITVAKIYEPITYERAIELLAENKQALDWDETKSYNLRIGDRIYAVERKL